MIYQSIKIHTGFQKKQDFVTKSIALLTQHIPFIGWMFNIHWKGSKSFLTCKLEQTQYI